MTHQANDSGSGSDNTSLTAEQLDALQRWEAYRAEMQNMEARMAKLARTFLDLKAYEDAAKCALRAEGMRWVLGRMPPPPKP